MDYETDNIIEWVFEKAFDQLTLDGQEINISPFCEIKKRTFNNTTLHHLLNHLTNRSTDKIRDYLSNIKFQEKFLFSKTKRKIIVDILLGNELKPEYWHRVDSTCLQLIILNERFSDLKLLLEENNGEIKLSNKLLCICAEYNYQDIYFYLREKGLFPNISVFNIAANGRSLSIIKDINSEIGISPKILSTIFKTNQTDIILELIKENSNFDPNLVVHPILNNNATLLFELEKQNLIKWHDKLLYSAILSGHIEMIKLIETRIPNIHDENKLDTNISEKKINKVNPLLLINTFYLRSGHKYFSHCINYAIQSGSLEMVTYIYQKGYGISVSNFITALRQNNIQILQFLIQKHDKPLPPYLIHYFGVQSYLPNKIERAKLLVQNGLLSVKPKIWNRQELQNETIHFEMIRNYREITEEEMSDPDFVMKYHLFFESNNENKLESRLISLIRLCLVLDLDLELPEIISQNKSNQQLMVDVLFLFGNLDKIKKFHPLININLAPSNKILLELMCYCQINKLCYLWKKELLSNQIVQEIYPLSILLDDKLLSSFFSKLNIDTFFDPNLIILSGNKSTIQKLVSDPRLELNLAMLQNILLMNDLDILRQFFINPKFLPELIQMAENYDLLEIAEYLTSLRNEIILF